MANIKVHKESQGVIMVQRMLVSALVMIYSAIGVNMSILGFVNICSSVTITYNGQEYHYNRDTPEYDKIYNALIDYIQSSHEMPALGVSLDSETKEAKSHGMWLEVHFTKTMTYLDMPFDSLLLDISRDDSGVNLIRGNKGVYEGRCYYLNGSRSLEEVYDTIYNIIDEIKP